MRAILAYLGIVFGVAYAITVPWVLGGARFDRASDTAANFGLSALFWVPALAAWVTRRFVERAPARRLVLPRPGYVLSVIFAPPLLAGVIYAMSALFGFVGFESDLQSMKQLLPADAVATLPPKFVVFGMALFSSMTFGLLFTCLSTAGEELGWTGFLLPRLLARFTPTQSALLYGTAWGLWLAPLVVGGFAYPQPAFGIALMTAFCIAVAQLQTAVWLRTKSVMATTLSHAAVNSQGRGLWPLLFPSATMNVMLGGLTGLVGILVIGGIGALWLRFEQRNAVAQHD